MHRSQRIEYSLSVIRMQNRRTLKCFYFVSPFTLARSGSGQSCRFHQAISMRPQCSSPTYTRARYGLDSIIRNHFLVLACVPAERQRHPEPLVIFGRVTSVDSFSDERTQLIACFYYYSLFLSKKRSDQTLAMKFCVAESKLAMR